MDAEVTVSLKKSVKPITASSFQILIKIMLNIVLLSLRRVVSTLTADGGTAPRCQ